MYTAQDSDLNIPDSQQCVLVVLLSTPSVSDQVLGSFGTVLVPLLQKLITRIHTGHEIFNPRIIV